jgi:hypothetical protein
MLKQSNGIERKKWKRPGREWMSKTSLALAARNRRKSSGKAISHTLFGGAAAACLVLGCGWTVYTHIIAASVYPTIDGAGYDEPVEKRPKLAARSAMQAVSEAFAAFPEAPVLSRPDSVASISPSMFNERFAASTPQGVESRAAEAPAPPGLDAPKVAEAKGPVDAPKLAEAKRSMDAPKLTAAPKPKQTAPTQVALNAPAAPPAADESPTKSFGLSVRDMAERAKAAVMSIASNERLSITEKLWGKEPSPHGSLLSYASADTSITGSIGRAPNPQPGGSPPYDLDTAVYDISAHMVYLPDGTRLEAHSGKGAKLDDPKSASIRMQGVTPPHIYELTPRESLFHGVAALRLNPIGGEDTIYGRSGLLAHTYMLGPNGDSNGCVSFKDYNAFLNAYRNQGIKKLAVVARIE